MGLRQPGGIRRLHVDEGGAAQGGLPVRSQDGGGKEDGQKGEKNHTYYKFQNHFVDIFYAKPLVFIMR